MEQEVEEEEEVRVDMVRTTARAPMPAFATDRSIDVVDEDEIAERQATNVADAISEEAGVYSQATNRGSNTVYLRGLVGPENLILVDGIRFNQSTFRTGPNQYLATLDPWATERAEVVRGPGSILYGSGAMGGVIQLFTRPIGDEDLQLRGILHYASADHGMGGAADAGFRHGALGATAGLTLRNHQTQSVGTRGNEDIFLAAEDGGQMMGSEFSQAFWRFGTEVEIDDDLDFEIRYMGGLIDDARRTDQLGRGQMRSTDNRDDFLATRFTAGDVAFVDELSLFGALHRTDELVRRYRCDLPQTTTAELRRCANLDNDIITDRREFRDIVTTLGTGITAISYLPIDLRLSYGAEFYRDHVMSSARRAASPEEDFQPLDRGNFADGSTYSTMGAYTHGEYPLWYSGDHEIVVNGGVRVEHFRAFAPDITPEIGDVEFANTGLVGGLGVSYLLGMGLNLYLNWNQGFRAPNLQETTVLGDTGNFFEVPNPDLNPERNDTFELGAKVSVAALGQLSANVFTSLMSDRITRRAGEFDGQTEIDGKPVQMRVNADRAYFYGSEARFDSANYFGLELMGNIAWIDGAVESPQEDPHFDPGPLHSIFAGDANWTHTRRLPPLQFLAGLSYRYHQTWSTTLFVQGAAAQTRLAGGDRNDLRICEVEPGVLAGDVGVDCLGTPGWATLNLRGTYRIEDMASVNLAVTNLTNQRYQHHGSGVLGPGIQAMITLVVQN